MPAHVPEVPLPPLSVIPLAPGEAVSHTTGHTPEVTALVIIQSPRTSAPLLPIPAWRLSESECELWSFSTKETIVSSGCSS